MAGLKRFQYTDKDHAAIVSDTIARIKEKYGENVWNDFEEDNAGLMLVEAFAYVTDLLLFYLDRQGNESYLPTATERQNLINICKLIGYNPSGAKPAMADIIVSIDKAHDTDVTLPANTQIETQSGVIFETDGDAVIRAGGLSVIVSATQGETFEETIGASNGEAYQEFYIPRSGVIKVMAVSVGEHTWDAVDSVADQFPDAKVYMVELDAWGRARISFGNGICGQIPREGENITVEYRIGGGVDGNVAPGAITNIRDVAVDGNGDSVPVSVTNPGWASGGSDPESAESIKLWAPRFFEAQKRCVTQRDYDTMAMAFDDPDCGAVAKAHAVVRERSGEANVIRYYVLAYGSRAGTVALASQALKKALLKNLNQYKQLTDWLEIEDGKWREVDFSGTLTIGNGFKSATVLDSVQKALESLMDIEIREMGEALRISDVYAAIDNVEGVVHVELSAPEATIEADIDELLVLGKTEFKMKVYGADNNGENF